MAPWFIKSLYRDDFQFDCSFKIKLEETFFWRHPRLETSLPRNTLRAILSRPGCSILGNGQKQLTWVKLRYSLVNGHSYVCKTELSLEPNFDKVWSKCVLTTMADISVYKPHTTHNSSIRLDEGLTLETSASESLYGGPFTLIKPNYYGRCSIFAILLNVQNVCF